VTEIRELYGTTEEIYHKNMNQVFSACVIDPCDKKKLIKIIHDSIVELTAVLGQISET
jgi:F0F1-type ATP synthase delta subunit